MDKLKYVKILQNEEKIPLTLEAQNVTMKPIGESNAPYNLQDIIGDISPGVIIQEDQEQEEKEWKDQNISERLEYLKKNKTDNTFNETIEDIINNINEILDTIGIQDDGENPATGIRAQLENLLGKINTLSENKLDNPSTGEQGQVLSLDGQGQVTWQTLSDLSTGTDTTLTVSGKPADGKAVGDRIAEIEQSGGGESSLNIIELQPEMNMLMLEPDGVDRFLGQNTTTKTTNSRLYYLQGSCFNYFDNNYNDPTAKNFYAYIRNASKPTEGSLIAFSLNDIKNKKISGLTSGISFGHGNDLEFLKDGSDYYIYAACGGEDDGLSNCIVRIKIDPLTGKAISSITSNEVQVSQDKQIPSDKAIWTIAYNNQDNLFYSCTSFNESSVIYKFNKNLELVEILENVNLTGVYLKENSTTQDTSQGSFFRKGNLYIISNGATNQLKVDNNPFYNRKTNFLNVIDLKTKKIKNIYSFLSWAPTSEVQSLAYDPINDIGYLFGGQGWLEITQVSFGTISKIDKMAHDIFSSGIALDKNTNLNDIYIPGKYICLDSFLASSLTNFPQIELSGFTMLVIPLAWNHLIQMIISNGMQIAIRRFNADSNKLQWESWRNITSAGASRFVSNSGAIQLNGGTTIQKLLSFNIQKDGYYHIIGYCDYPASSKGGARTCDIRIMNSESKSLNGCSQRVSVASNVWHSLQISYLGHLAKGTYHLGGFCSIKPKSKSNVRITAFLLS